MRRGVGWDSSIFGLRAVSYVPSAGFHFFYAEDGELPVEIPLIHDFRSQIPTVRCICSLVVTPQSWNFHTYWNGGSRAWSLCLWEHLRQARVFSAQSADHGFGIPMWYVIGS